MSANLADLIAGRYKDCPSFNERLAALAIPAQFQLIRLIAEAEYRAYVHFIDKLNRILAEPEEAKAAAVSLGAPLEEHEGVPEE